MEGLPKLILRSNTRRHRSRCCSRSLTIALPLPSDQLGIPLITTPSGKSEESTGAHHSTWSGPSTPRSTARWRRRPCASRIAVGLAAPVPDGDEQFPLTSADGQRKKFKSGARLRRGKQLRAAPRTQGMRSLRYEMRRIGSDMAGAQMAPRECSRWSPEGLPFPVDLDGQLCSFTAAAYRERRDAMKSSTLEVRCDL